ncbi:MAG: DUF2332 domain-containing protein [Microthrixaceae bacterium]
MTERVATIAASAAAFERLADAEGTAIPMYAALCRSIASDDAVAELLLHAPVGQRLPVLLLASLHDVILEDDTVPLAAWYPSVGGRADHEGDLHAALRDTLAARRDRVLHLLAHRQVQTNEVNRCVAWRLGLGELAAADERELTLVEVGASAGLNLFPDRYRIELESSGATTTLGPPDAPVQLSADLRAGPWTGSTHIPPVVSRMGLDQRPLDVSDPEDARWLTACVWPEQRERFDRLRAAIAWCAAAPPAMQRGDLVDDLDGALEVGPVGSHVVVLCSWVLAYVERAQRTAFLAQLSGAAARLGANGGRLSLLTLEADHVLPWFAAPALSPDESAERRHASLLVATTFDAEGTPASAALARCQAHLRWIERLRADSRSPR